VEAGRGKWVQNLKYHAGANQPKKIWLPASKPPACFYVLAVRCACSALGSCCSCCSCCCSLPCMW
jgi:hypothetical protein